MAVTGLILFGWILLHMAGNLKLYFGSEHFNEYARLAARPSGAPIVPESALLWVTRIVLLVAVIFHIHAAYALTMMNREARPIDYRDREYVKGTYAARTMRWGGVIILLFIIYHLAPPDDRTGATTTSSATTSTTTSSAAFRSGGCRRFYILANLALGLHLYHGVWSMFSSLGMTHPRFEQWRRTLRHRASRC